MPHVTPRTSLLTLTLAALAAAPAVGGATGVPAAQGPAQESDPQAENGARAARAVLRHVRVREGGATVRNIFDVQAVPLMDVPAGGLLAVYAERGGWLEVEAPGGFPVWVYGRFLRPTGQASVLEVTHNNVHMRPSPNTGNASFPLDRRLQAGDLVTALEPLDPEADLADTWVRIWTPPGVGAWVQSARTTSLAEGEDGAALFAAAEDALFELAAANEAVVFEAAAPEEANVDTSGAGRVTVRSASATAVGRAAEALAGARALLERERTQPLPDFDAVESALRGVLELAPDAVTRTATLKELEKVALLRDLERVEAQLAQREQREREALLERQEERWSEVEAGYPLRGRFEERGVVESYRAASGASAVRLSRAGQVVAELVCSSGRYDLELFLGAEIGLAGDEDGRGRLHVGVPQVDVTAIEVLTPPRR